MNRKTILYVVGRLLIVESGLLLLPFLVSLLYRENSQYPLAFLYTIIMTFSVGLLCSYKQNQSIIKAREGAVIVALSWILLSFFGGLPFVFSGDIPSLVDAFFETASGFTTTGSSVLSTLSPLAKSTLFWRSFTHLIGGMGVLVFFLAVLPKAKSDSAQLLRAEVPGPVFGKLVSKLSESARILYAIYLIFTAIFVVVLMIGGGVPLFDATLLAFGTAGTGGFAINDLGFAIYHNPIFVEYAIAIGMLLFGINFNLYYYFLIRHVKEIVTDEELHWYLGIISVAIIAIMLNIMHMMPSVEENFRKVFFTVASLVTTTGYGIADFAQWPLFSQLILTLLMFVGGCAGSTAGGIKVSRIALYIKQAISELLRMGHPNRIVSVRFNKKTLSSKESLKLSHYLFVYIIVFVFILLSVSFEANDFSTAFSSVAATFNNIGPGLSGVGPTKNFAFYSDWNKIVLSLGMIAGRLEIFPILVLFAPSTLKKMVCTKRLS